MLARLGFGDPDWEVLVAGILAWPIYVFGTFLITGSITGVQIIAESSTSFFWWLYVTLTTSGISVFLATRCLARVGRFSLEGVGLSWNGFKLRKTVLPGLLVLLVWVGISAFLSSLNPDEAPAIEVGANFLKKERGTTIGATVFLATGILVPFSEELYDRAFLYGELRRLSGRPIVAAVLASGVFALWHLEWSSIVFAFVLGICFCWLFERIGSLWPSLFLHVTINSFGGLAALMEIK